MKTAVIVSGAHQYLVKHGQVIEVEKLETKEGGTVELDCLLFVDGNKVKIGQPLLAKKIKAKVLKTIKGKKIRVAKFKAKSRYRKVKGHRQISTHLDIIDESLVEKNNKSSSKKASSKIE